MDKATYANMRSHLSTHYLTPHDLGALAAEAKASRLVLTHFAIPPGPVENSEPAMRQGISGSYQGPVEFARDLAAFNLGCE